MIKITHINGDTKVVTLGAYEGIFKPLGYKPVEVETETVIKPVEVETKEVVEPKKEETGVKSFEIKKEDKLNTKSKRK